MSDATPPPPLTGSPFGAQPPPPTGPPAAPHFGAIPAAHAPPPLGRYSPVLVIPPAAATAEERAEEKRNDRNALQRLIAAPEMVATFFWLLLMIVFASTDAGSGAFVLILICTSIAALFIFMALRSGDALVFALILVALGFFTAISLGVTFAVGRSSLWWLLPAVAVIAAENAISYNFYRRRNGEISRAIARTQAQNLGAMVLGSVVLGLLLRSLSDGRDRLSWIWFAAVSTTIVVLAIGSLIVVRRQAVPADRRRFSPGRRMIPPPS